MVNVRSKPKTKSGARNIALKREPTDPTPPTVQDDANLDEARLRKLSRAELQKLAKVHSVRANMKSELIIQQMLNVQRSKRSRPAEDGPHGEPSQKRIKKEAVFGGSPWSHDQEKSTTSGPPLDVPSRAVEDPQAGPSAPRSAIPEPTKPVALPYDEELFSGTESEMTEEEQPDYTTPVSTRSGTPPPANVVNLEHCVTVMRQISEKDVTLLKEVTEVRETAARLRKRAKDVRDLVKAERGRRERMEAYFRYWQEIQPRWSRKWLYGEKEGEDVDAPSEQDKVPEAHKPRERRGQRKRALSPEEVKRRRHEIVSKQEAQQRELEALRRAERSKPSEAVELAGEEGSDEDELEESIVDQSLRVSP